MACDGVVPYSRLLPKNPPTISLVDSGYENRIPVPRLWSLFPLSNGSNSFTSIIPTFLMSARLSGMQKEVLALYRTFLREAFKKDGLTDPISPFPSLLVREGTTTNYARHEFRKQAHQVTRSDFKTIEYKMRKGQKHLKMLQMPGVKVVSGTSS